MKTTEILYKREYKKFDHRKFRLFEKNCSNQMYLLVDLHYFHFFSDATGDWSVLGKAEESNVESISTF